MNPGPEPLRTCIGCRQKAPAGHLLRVVAVEGIVTPDPRRRLPGRGAHLHRSPSCLAQALRRRAFRRALRIEGVDEPGAYAELERELGGSAADA